MFITNLSILKDFSVFYAAKNRTEMFFDPVFEKFYISLKLLLLFKRAVQKLRDLQ